MAYCVVLDGKISNIVEASAAYAVEQGWVENQGWGIGWVGDGAGGFVPPSAPPEPVPASCQRRQGRLELIDIDALETVEAFIESIADPKLRQQARVEYEADAWERANPFLVSVWLNVVGRDEAALDDMFRRAVKR